MICQVRCACCSNIVEPKVLFYAKQYSGNGNIVKCINCNLVFIYPMIDDNSLLKVYSGLYVHKTLEINQQQIDWAYRCINTHIANLNKINCWPKSTFLDLAGGLGYYSKGALLAGLTPTLVDLDQKSISFAKDRLGIKQSYCMSIKEFLLAFKDKKYDIVFLRHVIEHVSEPDVLISCVDSLLSNDGVLILETPNSNSFEFLFKSGTRNFFLKYYKNNYQEVNFFTLFLKKIYAIRPPHHLFAFNIKNLELLLKRKGMLTVKGYFYALGDSIYWPNSKNMIFSDVVSQLRKGNVKKSFVYFSDFIFKYVRFLLQKIQMSSGMGVYVKKDIK